MSQLGLFGETAPFQPHSKTSRAAGHAIEVKMNHLQRVVYDCLVRSGCLGLTDDELQIRLKMDPSTERPRRVELVNKGSVVDSGRVRLTRSGKRATVWIITDNEDRNR